MTIVAEITTHNMLSMFTGCAAVIMALSAVNGRALELSCNMATGAVDKLVFAGERETRCEMVKTGSIIGCVNSRCKQC